MKGVRLSISMMVKNGEDVIERALRSVAPLAPFSEICLHVIDSSDKTASLAWKLASDLSFQKFSCLVSRPEKNPGAFFLDSQDSFALEFDGKWTGKHLMRDWSWGRNASLSMCEGDYVLRLDADDVFVMSENVEPTLNFLDSRPDIDILACPYAIMDGQEERSVEMADKIWRRGKVRWTRVMHEHLAPKQDNWIMTAAGLKALDMRDSKGDGIRVHGRNFKTLLFEHERRVRNCESNDVDFLFTLGHEAVAISPDFARRVLSVVTTPRFRGAQAHEAYFHVARSYELEGRREEALGAYRSSLDLKSTPNVLLARSKLLFEMGDERWKEDLREAKRLMSATTYFNVDLKLLRQLEGASS